VTDRELLISIRDQINVQLETVPPCPNPVPPGALVIEPNSDPTGTPKGNFSGWLWPMPIYEGEPPVISDGFNRYAHGEPGDPDYERQHLGADIMYKNAHEMIPDLPEVTKWFHCPSNTIPMLATGPGHIWYAGLTAQGWTIKIDHHAWAGFPLVTYCTHMSELFIEPWFTGDEAEGKGKAGGQYVYAGFQLGYVGNSPLGEDPNHCHYEMWDYSEGVPSGRENRALDPELYLPYFGKLVMLEAA
jgi:murein DD-endopeptidase MepM/ murein hydrolase activator NlpD